MGMGSREHLWGGNAGDVNSYTGSPYCWPAYVHSDRTPKLNNEAAIRYFKAGRMAARLYQRVPLDSNETLEPRGSVYSSKHLVLQEAMPCAR